jgi:hypothetical protein
MQLLGIWSTVSYYIISHDDDHQLKNNKTVILMLLGIYWYNIKLVLYKQRDCVESTIQMAEYSVRIKIMIIIVQKG